MTNHADSEAPDPARQYQLRVSEEEESERLDLYLQKQLPGLSRSRLQGLIYEGEVTVDNRQRRPSYRVRAGDEIAVAIPELRPLTATPETSPLDVVFEDNDLLVVDKPAGMTVHPAPGSPAGTLVNALLHHCQDLSGINGVLRPGIVHRLDRNTTGLLVVAKNDSAHRGLASQLERRSMTRHYRAIVWGRLPERGSVDAPIDRSSRDRKRMAVAQNGRHAVTHFEQLSDFGFVSDCRLRLETGRTHQIRVHMQHRGNPVFGDPMYGGRNRVDAVDPQQRSRARRLLEGLTRQALHAAVLGFVHPRSGKSLCFESDLPEDLRRLHAELSAG
ncbi:MAG: RluA family pseudouridine synthase [Candidatus Latescibacterota bacterium]|nr:RluA family pseudouridine synthase [Candidatus Latescibacterota bacterium]